MAALFDMKVGEKRVIDGVLVECVLDECDDELYCWCCALSKPGYCNPQLCCPTYRKDGNPVHFREVES